MSSYQCYVPSRWSSGSLGEGRGEIQGDPRPVGSSVRAGDDQLLFVNINLMRYFLFILINLLCTAQNGTAAASLSVAEQYVLAFSNLAKESNTVLLPTNTGDISGMVTQVLPPHFRPGIMHFFCVSERDWNVPSICPHTLRRWPSTARWQNRSQKQLRRRWRKRRRRAKSRPTSRHRINSAGARQMNSMNSEEAVCVSSRLWSSELWAEFTDLLSEQQSETLFPSESFKNLLVENFTFHQWSFVLISCQIEK